MLRIGMEKSFLFLLLKVSSKGIKHRVSLFGAIDLCSQMETKPYDLSDHELEIARKFENYFLDVNNTSSN